jgi:hypothetical protein
MLVTCLIYVRGPPDCSTFVDVNYTARSSSLVTRSGVTSHIHATDQVPNPRYPSTQTTTCVRNSPVASTQTTTSIPNSPTVSTRTTTRATHTIPRALTSHSSLHPLALPSARDTYDEWLAQSLAEKDKELEELSLSSPLLGSSTIRLVPPAAAADYVPMPLVELLESIRLPRNGNAHSWAQWVMDTALAIPPSQLASLIEKHMEVKTPLASLIGRSALRELASDINPH